MGTKIKIQEEPIWRTMWGPCFGHKRVIFRPFLGLLIHWVVKWKTGHSCRPLVLLFCRSALETPHLVWIVILLYLCIWLVLEYQFHWNWSFIIIFIVYLDQLTLIKFSTKFTAKIRHLLNFQIKMTPSLKVAAAPSKPPEEMTVLLRFGDKIIILNHYRF